MNDATPNRLRASLVERAAERFAFTPRATPAIETPAAPAFEPAMLSDAHAPFVMPERHVTRRRVTIDRMLLAEQNMLVPGAPVGVLAEEFRLIKRQLLLTAARVEAKTGSDAARMILVGSANPGDGKTYSAINLAISMAAERDTEVVLVDADFAKPDLAPRLGLPVTTGLLDVIADPTVDVESCILETDIPQLCVLPAGERTASDTELLASDRTKQVLSDLLAANPRRIVIFDTAPALAASPASVLALHVGQVMLVVRADRTTESAVREAVGLLDGCEHIQLVLNGVSFTSGNQRFGSYYGQGDLK